MTTERVTFGLQQCTGDILFHPLIQNFELFHCSATLSKLFVMVKSIDHDNILNQQNGANKCFCWFIAIEVVWQRRPSTKLHIQRGCRNSASNNLPRRLIQGCYIWRFDHVINAVGILRQISCQGALYRAATYLGSFAVTMSLSIFDFSVIMLDLKVFFKFLSFRGQLSLTTRRMTEQRMTLTEHWTLI